MTSVSVTSRARGLAKGLEKGRCILHWMSRDQRVSDNPSLLFAILKGNELRLPVISCFCLVPNYLEATIRQYSFMLKGLREVESSLLKLGVGFRLLTGNPGEELSILIKEEDAAALICDFDPLRPKQSWKKEVLGSSELSVYEVDAHNIVPCWIASFKREYSAGTFRPKLKSQLSQYFLEPLPTLSPSVPWKENDMTDWERAERSLKVGRSVKPVNWIIPGEEASRKALHSFIEKGLIGYARRRNNPEIDGQSNLSPYLHFGQLSPHRVAWEVTKSSAPEEDKSAFLEELIVRRELADNFCFYCPNYDSVDCFPEWARASLEKHRLDRREYSYDEKDLEAGNTHDPLWNAAQREMVVRGKMHGYLRMYWAKKLLEWCSSPEEAMRVAIRLNDRYELDGRDPNGYAGIAWSIGGVHDRPWPSRPIFGKIRYMSLTGARAKFDVDAYIHRVESLSL
ncbi:MAG: deoxyribodipyrimidine photo-lyase [Methanomassiliicoccales archaeon]